MKDKRVEAILAKRAKRKAAVEKAQEKGRLADKQRTRDQNEAGKLWKEAVATLRNIVNDLNEELKAGDLSFEIAESKPTNDLAENVRRQNYLADFKINLMAAGVTYSSLSVTIDSLGNGSTRLQKPGLSSSWDDFSVQQFDSGFIRSFLLKLSEDSFPP